MMDEISPDLLADESPHQEPHRRNSLPTSMMDKIPPDLLADESPDNEPHGLARGARGSRRSKPQSSPVSADSTAATSASSAEDFPNESELKPLEKLTVEGECKDTAILQEHSPVTNTGISNAKDIVNVLRSRGGLRHRGSSRTTGPTASQGWWPVKQLGGITSGLIAPA